MDYRSSFGTTEKDNGVWSTLKMTSCITLAVLFIACFTIAFALLVYQQAVDKRRRRGADAASQECARESLGRSARRTYYSVLSDSSSSSASRPMSWTESEREEDCSSSDLVSLASRADDGDDVGHHHSSSSQRIPSPPGSFKE